jgi:hypothetical protein
MALSAPRYIQNANIQVPTIGYKWDDWDFEQAEAPISKRLAARLRKTSWRANMAFAAASAEWLVYRFEKLLDDPTPFDYFEAAWAQIVDFHYGFIFWDPLHDDEFVGPVKGPIREGLAWVMEIIRVSEEGEHPARMCASLAKLTTYVMPDPAPYRQWLKDVVRRLAVLYPFNPKDELGEVVPREVLDPTFDFQPEQTEALVNRFLAKLDPAKNSFLRDPDEMLEEGFEATPYVFNETEDRENRLTV